jgi:2-polyprenyl-3-methyl-5-hydroxy-6-metoxy-1,4-benzoquinol methylase
MVHPGPLIRRLFGRYEHGVAEAYRRIFVDLDDLARLMREWVPQAQRILEVGCGEGAMTERLARTYPAASINAVDVTPRVGRLYRGPAAAVSFCRENVEDIARRSPASFDLVVLADVMHHVPPDSRRSLMVAIDQAMAPNGALIFKDWLVSSSPIHWLCGASDRYLTGDDVSYFTREALNALVTGSFGPGSICRTDTVRPWRNNVAVLVRR